MEEGDSYSARSARTKATASSSTSPRAASPASSSHSPVNKTHTHTTSHTPIVSYNVHKRCHHFHEHIIISLRYSLSMLASPYFLSLAAAPHPAISASSLSSSPGRSASACLAIGAHASAPFLYCCSTWRTRGENERNERTKKREKRERERERERTTERLVWCQIPFDDREDIHTHTHTHTPRTHLPESAEHEGGHVDHHEVIHIIDRPHRVVLLHRIRPLDRILRPQERLVHSSQRKEEGPVTWGPYVCRRVSYGVAGSQRYGEECRISQVYIFRLY